LMPPGQMTYDMSNCRFVEGPGEELIILTGWNAVPGFGQIRNAGFDGTPSPTGITGYDRYRSEIRADGKDPLAPGGPGGSFQT